MQLNKGLFSTCALLLLCLMQACSTAKDYYKLPAFTSEKTVNAVVEISAGTNKKYEYKAHQKEFVPDQLDGAERVIDFLPYPGNYGFIPSTLAKTNLGGDGDALDVLVLSEAMSRGTVVNVHPIALLKLVDDGALDYKVIAVPVDLKKQIIAASTFKDLVSKYPKIIEIIELWFLNYNPKDISTIEGWGDQNEALEAIKQHMKN